MAVALARAKSKTPPSKGKGASEPANAPARTTTGDRNPARRPGAFYAAKPAVGLKAPVQAKVTVGAANDRYEQEANTVAHRVVNGQSAPVVNRLPASGLSAIQSRAENEAAVQAPAEEETVQSLRLQRQADNEEPIQTHPLQQQSDDAQLQTQPEEETIQPLREPSRVAESGIRAPANLEARLLRARGGGAPLDSETRLGLEEGFGADFSGVRVHTDAEAVELNRRLGARAFTHGNDLFFNAREYQPHSREGRQLLAHELTHTLQQGASPWNVTAQRRPMVSAAPHQVQGFIPDFVREELNDYARHIPGYTLFTVIIGFNPLSGREVERNAVNLLEGLMGLVPFGTYIFDKLKEHGILRDAFDWVEGELGRLDLSLSRIERTIEAAWDDMELIEGFDYNLGILEKHFARLLADVKAFAVSLVSYLMELIKEVALDLAEGLLEDIKTWDLIKKVLRYDPLRGKAMEATTVEIIEDFLRLIGKEEELRQMQERGVVEQAAAWIDTQLARFFGILAGLAGLFAAAWEAIQPENLPSLATSLRSLATQAVALLQDLWTFAAEVAAKVLELIKDALLGWLSTYADDIPGFHLLTVLLGFDPFTEEPVPRTPTNLIRGFMSLVPGGERQFQQLQETGVIPAAAQRIESLISTLGITWEYVQGLFLELWNAFTIDDVAKPLDAFVRIVERFAEPIGRLFTFVVEVIKVVLELVLTLMNFPSEILGRIIRNATAAIEDIKRDPVGFLKNMLRAVKEGFSGFFDNILQYLLSGVTDWLFGQLRKAGIEPPTEITLASVLDLVLQILGLSVERLWKKLAERIGQDKVDKIRRVIDKLTGIWTFVRDVQERGISAVWEYIQSQISNLWDMVLEQVRNWIVTRIIEKVVTKLLSMLDPTGIMAVVNSFIAFFNAVQSAIEYFREMLLIIDNYVSTIASVARGEIQPGAEKLEQGLAGSIPVAIGFLANQVGLGNLAEKIAEIVSSIRGVIDKALDWLLDKAVKIGQALLKSLGLGDTDQQQEQDQESQGVKSRVGKEVRGKTPADFDEEKSLLDSLYKKYTAEGLKGIKFDKQGDEIVVIVSASLAEEVARLDLSQKTGQKRLLNIMKKMRYLSRSTTIYAYYNGELIDEVSNYPGHAEVYFVTQSVELIRSRLIADIDAGTLPANGEAVIHMDITRSPCHGCATTHVPNAITAIKAPPLSNLNVRLSINATAVTQGPTGTAGLEALLEPEKLETIEIKASDLWDVIINTLSQHPQFYYEVTQKHYRRDELEEFRRQASDLQGEIDFIVSKNKRKTKDYKKGDI